jgi:hypothetical protein
MQELSIRKMVILGGVGSVFGTAAGILSIISLIYETTGHRLLGFAKDVFWRLWVGLQGIGFLG